MAQGFCHSATRTRTWENRWYAATAPTAPVVTEAPSSSLLPVATYNSATAVSAYSSTAPRSR